MTAYEVVSRFTGDTIAGPFTTHDHAEKWAHEATALADEVFAVRCVTIHDNDEHSRRVPAEGS